MQFKSGVIRMRDGRNCRVPIGQHDAAVQKAGGRILPTVELERASGGVRVIWFEESDSKPKRKRKSLEYQQEQRDVVVFDPVIRPSNLGLTVRGFELGRASDGVSMWSCFEVELFTHCYDPKEDG